MANRYARDSRVKAGTSVGTNTAAYRIQQGIKSGDIKVKKYILKQGERLDHVAGRAYGDSSLWWVIAAASKIGWGLQLPPGVVLVVPSSLREVQRYVG